MNSLTSAVAAVIADPAGRVLLCQQRQGHRLWGLPGGKIEMDESPLHAAVRDIRAEVGTDVTLIELIGMYQLTDGHAGQGTAAAAAGANGSGSGLADVLVHVFRARAEGEVTVNAPDRISRICWFDVNDLPAPLTATSRAAIADAATGRAGVLRAVHRTAEPELPDAVDGAAAADAIVSMAAP